MAFSGDIFDSIYYFKTYCARARVTLQKGGTQISILGYSMVGDQ